MAAEQEQDANGIALPAPTHEPRTEETLTDVIDRLSRKAFRRSLERRHAAPGSVEDLDSAGLAGTTP